MKEPPEIVRKLSPKDWLAILTILISLLLGAAVARLYS